VRNCIDISSAGFRLIYSFLLAAHCLQPYLHCIALHVNFSEPRALRSYLFCISKGDVMTIRGSWSDPALQIAPQSPGAVSGCGYTHERGVDVVQHAAAMISETVR